MATVQEIQVPDIGDFSGVEIIEVLVKPGDKVNKEDSLIALESDKATMEIPSPQSGVVKEMKVNVGRKVSQGDLILLLEVKEEAAETESGKTKSPINDEAPLASTSSASLATSPLAPVSPPVKAEPVSTAPAQDLRPSPTAHISGEPLKKAHASPSVRRFARELGANLNDIKGTGPKQRILKQDVQNYVKQVLTSGAGGFTVAEIPEVDFSKYGEIEYRPLSRINKLTGQNTHRNWVRVPHVTQHDEADITELEAFRKSLNRESDGKEVKITFLPFLMKAVVSALKEYPRFNSSLDTAQETLIYKRYFNIGVAVDTPQGLVVPVIRDVERKNLVELATELAKVSDKARRGKLTLSDLQGGCFTISSLGGIGGTRFNPIVNAPEVAILGVSKAEMKPVFRNGEFVPRLILPLSLSYDHRVIDGADGARFVTFLSALLSETRRMLL